MDAPGPRQVIALCSAPIDSILWKNRYNQLMKLDLPKAIALLATGAACIWLARSPQSAPPGASAGTDKNIPALQVSHGETGSPNSANPEQLLADSIRQLQSLDGLIAQLDIEVDMLGEKSTATGSYIQTGQGVPRARWDFSFNNPEFSLSVSQVFDGRFHYRMTDFGDSKALEYVDLYQVPDLPEPKITSIAGPTGWFGVGGLPTLLRQLQGSFEFQFLKTEESVVGDHKIVFQTIRGTWRQDALQQLLHGQVDPASIEPEVRWDQLPIQLPHAVEITFGSDGYLDNFPYRVVFLQKSGSGSTYQNFVSLKLHHVARKNDIAADTFTIPSEYKDPVDKTSDYIARVRMFLSEPFH